MRVPNKTHRRVGKPMDVEVDHRSETYSCTLCGIRVSSEKTLNSHLQGRLHQLNLDRSQSAERSVYVRGFPKTSSKAELIEFFVKFGPVHDVWMSGDGYSAIVKFADAAVAEEVLHASEPLYLDGRKLTVKPRDIKPHAKRSKSNAQHRDDKDQHTKIRLPKSKVHHHGEIGQEKEQLKFDPEVIQQISVADSTDDQLRLISSHFKIPMSAAHAHLTICKALSEELKIHFPDCMVVPFGAVISGHGTLTSDCDICLLTHPSQQQRALFSGSSYYPPGLCLQVDNAMDSPCLLPPCRSRENSLSGNSEASSDAASPTQFPGNSDIDRGSQHHFDIVVSCVRQMSQCSKVLAISHARCPIVRFTFHPPGIHCDLSINNLLGPANTRLMQAYFQFDDRFAVLVPFVRLWVKYNGPPRSQLNNYTVSLLLIYALQRSQPPVLPCLQNPGSWPKNMAWFTKHGFASSLPPSFAVGPWNCDFVPPESLLPSTNTQSAVELLLHFFKFYSEWRGKDVVAIHCPPERTISPSEAKALATSQTQLLGYTLRPFKETSPLIVQDPFELDHNLCKALTHENVVSFIHHMKIAAELLVSRKSLLFLFQCGEYQQAKMKLFVEPKKMVFYGDGLRALLTHSKEFTALAECVDEVDLKDATIHHSVSKVALKTVASYLHDKMNFTCSDNDATQMQEDNSSNLNSSESVLTTNESMVSISTCCNTALATIDQLRESTSTDSVTALATIDQLRESTSTDSVTALATIDQPKESTSTDSDTALATTDQLRESTSTDSITALATDMSSKSDEVETCQFSFTNEVASSTHSAEVAGPQAKHFKSVEAISRKRAHSGDRTGEDECADETKRARNGSISVAALDVLRLAEQKCQSDVYYCTAVADTWTHRRQRLRQLDRDSSSLMDTGELSGSLPALPPLLRVKLSTDCSYPPKVVINIGQLPPLNNNKFKNWYALVNKELHSASLQ